jgi:hypothetical protein
MHFLPGTRSLLPLFVTSSSPAAVRAFSIRLSLSMRDSQSQIVRSLTDRMPSNRFLHSSRYFSGVPLYIRHAMSFLSA